MADNRTMAQMLQAPIEGYEDAIVVPPINANNFELKQPLINLVQSNKFTGRQDPHNHLRFFNKVTSTFRHPEVPNTSVKLLLFPFSLDGEARDWLDKEPPRSILTWDDLVSKFINQYFPPSKTTYYRNEIITFYQKPNEAFNEAWERFKGLLRQCPHHGFSELHQLDTFYNSLNSNDQDALDSAAGGNFLDKMPQEGLAIIESKSKVRYSRSRANDSRVSTDAPLSNSSLSNNSFDMQQIAASLEDKMTIKMNQMMNQMKALVVTTPAPVKAVEERCTTCGNNHSFSVCPMTRGSYEYPVYHDNFQQFQQTASVGNFVQNGNSGYRAPNLANQMRPPGFNQPNPQASRPHQGYNVNQGYNGNRNVNQTNQVNHGANSGLSQQAQAYQVPSTQAPVTYSRFEAYTKANDATLNNLQKNLNDFKKEQQDFQNEQRNFQNMMLNMFQKQMGNNNASSSGTLPSNTITNPRCEARAITTRSGLSYTPVPPIPPPLYDENEPLTEKETEVTKDKVLPSTKDIQPPVIQKSHDPVKPVSSPISPEPSSAQVNNSPPSKEPSKETHLPYPSRVEYEKKGENDKVQIQKFWEMFKKIHVDITLADALILMPKYQKMLKSLLSNKEKLNEMANTPVSEKWPSRLANLPDDLRNLANCSLCVPKGIALRDVLVPGLLLKNARFYIDDHGEELVIRMEWNGISTILLLHTSTIVEEFDLLWVEIIKQKEKVKEISDPVARRRACFLDKFRIINQGRVIHSPKIAFVGSEMLLEEEIDEFLKHDESLNMDLNDEFNDEEGDKIYLEKLLENENFFEMNDKKVEFFERKTKEDFETKVEPKKDIDRPDTFHEKSFEKDAFKNKSSKELAPSKALLTLDVFDPLHPPLMDLHVTKALFSGVWKIHGLKLWKDKAMPTISIEVPGILPNQKPEMPKGFKKNVALVYIVRKVDNNNKDSKISQIRQRNGKNRKKTRWEAST
ncbi:reverse transcriptase domain-containing protein [Tanacetum coccineum]